MSLETALKRFAGSKYDRELFLDAISQATALADISTLSAKFCTLIQNDPEVDSMLCGKAEELEATADPKSLLTLEYLSRIGQLERDTQTGAWALQKRGML